MRRELARKAFHLLSLTYLWAYLNLGLKPFLVWTVFIVVVETWRLKSATLNEWLTRQFRGLAREEEKDKYSGVIHTTLGALVVFVAFGDERAIVVASICCVAFGDAAAALVGKAWGRIRLGTNKSLEGSAACFIACYVVCSLTGFSNSAAAVAAAAATVIEFLPTTRWMNDNFWMPIAAGAALSLCAGS